MPDHPAAAAARWTVPAFGAVFSSEFALPGMHPAAAGDAPDVRLALVAQDEIDERWRAPGTVLWSTLLDGHEVAVERGADGSHRFRLGALGDCLLSAHRRELACAPAVAEDPVWQRILLDTVFFCCMLVHGGVALHASAVERDGHAVGIVAASGGGKTSLALALLDRGWSLLSDDVVFPFSRHGAIHAHPGPPLMNVPDALASPRLGQELARFPDAAEVWTAVNRHAAKVAVLRSLCFLDRRPGPWLELRTMPPDPMLITANAIYLAQGPDAARERFERLSDVAAQVQALHLRADPRVPPAALAEALDGAMDDLGEMP